MIDKNSMRFLSGNVLERVDEGAIEMVGLSLAAVIISVGSIRGMLWPKGVVHYTINKKDYDIHSQDVVSSTFAQLEKEVCVKFFNTPFNYSASAKDKILYISNPDKRKTCPPDHYDYTGSVVDMPIGYKCLNQRDIARIAVDMLRASIEQTVSTVNSYDLVKKFQQRDQDTKRESLLSPNDRNYINAHYHAECGTLAAPGVGVGAGVGLGARRAADPHAASQLSEANEQYYTDKLWPLGIVLFGVEEKLRGTTSHSLLKYAMASIELSTCVVFQETRPDDNVLSPKNLLWFGSDGEGAPALGFKQGNQTVSLQAVSHGAPGHTAHTICNLLRALGLPMMSNRYDRDNYVIVNWKHVAKGMEHYLEKAPLEAWVQHLPYDFDSATHAPANYMCGDCAPGVRTVDPVQDHLWQRTLSMGHRSTLSESDIGLVNLLYSKECRHRYLSRET